MNELKKNEILVLDLGIFVAVDDVVLKVKNLDFYHY